VDGTPVNTNLLIAPGETEIEDEVTVRPPPVAVKVCVPAVLNFTTKGLVPELSVAEDGMVPAGSLEVMVMLLVLVVAVFPTESLAVTLMVKETAAVALVGTRVSTSCVAAPAETAIAAVVAEVSVPEVAVMVLDPTVFRVKERVPVPLVKGAEVGSVAAVSVEV
jgi:hypothetical protein